MDLSTYCVAMEQIHEAVVLGCNTLERLTVVGSSTIRFHIGYSGKDGLISERH